MFIHLSNLVYNTNKKDRIGSISSRILQKRNQQSKTKTHFYSKDKNSFNLNNQNSLIDLKITPLIMPTISPQNKDKQRENLKIDFNSLFKQSYTNKHSISKEIHLFSLDYNPSQDFKTKTIVQENEGFQFSPSISVISYRLQPITTKHNIISFDSNKNINNEILIVDDENKKNKKLPPIIEKENKIPSTKIIPRTPPNYYSSIFNYYIVYPDNCGYLIKKCLSHRINWKESHTLLTNRFDFKWKDCSVGINFSFLSSKNKQIVNHFEYHSSLSNKAKLFKNLFTYCERINKEIFQYIPFSVVIDLNDQPSYGTISEGLKIIFDNIENYLFDYSSIKDKIFSRRKVSYSSIFPNKDGKTGLKTNIVIPNTHYNGKNYWIIKAPNLNRGRCIKLVNSMTKLYKIIKLISVGECNVYSDEKNNKLNEVNVNSKYQSSIVLIQKYIERPFLYNGRKFDIRIWVLITHKYEVYAFKEGHMKACSVNYDLNNIENSFIHLTNYSLQKYNQNFSKFEKGNEISFDTFQDYLNDKNHNINIKNDIYPKIKEIIEITTRSVKHKINENNKEYSFEIFGYDFMMDEDFNVFLIEINTNPGLEESSEIIKMLIPRMIDDALRLTIDDLFQPTLTDEWKNINGEYKSNFKVNGYSDEENMWELICNLKEIAQSPKRDSKRLNDIKKRTKSKKKKMHIK